ncbi:MAG: YadA C-terminal domain-containing protein [Pseudomonadota bacterium]
MLAPAPAPVQKAAVAAPQPAAAPALAASAPAPASSPVPTITATSVDGGFAPAPGEGVMTAMAPGGVPQGASSALEPAGSRMVTPEAGADASSVAGGRTLAASSERPASAQLASASSEPARTTAEQPAAQVAMLDESQSIAEPPANADMDAGTRDVITPASSSAAALAEASAAAPISVVSDAQFAALSGRVETLEGQVSTLFDLSNTIDRDAQRGIASIAAQANPHFPSEAGKTSYASNVATYRGEVGISAGLMHRFEGDFAITAGVTYAGGNSTSVRAGIAGEF